MKKIKIGATLNKIDHWDFGLFPNPQKEILVNEEFWKEFVDARFKYEMLYDKLKAAII